jgi:hypothetical protein
MGILVLLTSCSKEFLDKKPLGKETTESFFGDPSQADENFEKLIIAAYEAYNFDEGQWGGIGHHGEWMWDLVTDDAQKGGDGAGDYATMMNWRSWKPCQPIWGLHNRHILHLMLLKNVQTLFYSI